MSNGASVLAEPLRQFVDDVTAVLVELGRGSSPASTLERDAALEAQAIAASVIASDGRYSDTELRAFATALSPWFDSLRRATPQQLRGGDAIRQYRAWPITPSPLFETVVSADSRNGTSNGWRYYQAALRVAHAGAALDEVPTRERLLAVDTLRTMMLRRLAAAKVERPADMPRGVGEPEPLEDRRAPAARPLDELLAELDALVGLAALKTEVRLLTNLIRVENLRRERKLTGLAYIARATIDALREFPELNATLEGETFTTYEGVHLGIAVSLGSGGLIVPVIRDAQDFSVEGLASRIKDLARRARANALTPDEVQGGSFTITNPGGYGSILATPVINQPQVAILDTEAVVKRPVVITDEHGTDSIAIRSMMYLCMSWDHRALDGALAAQFLSSLRKKLETWPI